MNTLKYTRDRNSEPTGKQAGMVILRTLRLVVSKDSKDCVIIKWSTRNQKQQKRFKYRDGRTSVQREKETQIRTTGQTI